MGQVRVIRADELVPSGDQTRGMARLDAISAQLVGAQGLWMGLVRLPPGAVSAVHHHGPYETAAYVLRGRLRVRFGEGLAQEVEAGPGDFLFVPAHLPHQELNPSPEEPVEVVAARNSPHNVALEVEGVSA